MDMTRSPVSLWDMLRLNSERFLHLIRNLGVLEGLMVPKGNLKTGGREPPALVTVDPHMRKEAAELVTLLDELDLPFSKREAERFGAALAVESIDSDRGFAMVQSLQSRVQDELETRHVVVMTDLPPSAIPVIRQKSWLKVT